MWDIDSLLGMNTTAQIRTETWSNIFIFNFLFKDRNEYPGYITEPNNIEYEYGENTNQK